MLNISEVDAAYIAGLIDGEGCICICKTGHNDKNYTSSFAPRVSVANTYFEIIMWLKQVTNVGKILTRQTKSIKHKTGYEWRLLVNDIVPLLEKVLPYLKIKKKQAYLIMEFINNTTWHGRTNPLTMDEYALKEVIFDELAILNKRGPQ